MLDVQCFDNPREMANLQPVWSDLLRHDPDPSIYKSHGFATAWLRALPAHAHLRLLLVKDHDQPVALAPMVLRRRWRGLWPGRSLSFLVPRGDVILTGDGNAAISALVDAWGRMSPQWDVIELRHLADNSPLAAALPTVSSLRVASPLVAVPGAFLDTTGSWQQHLDSRTSHFVKRLRQTCNKIHRLGRVTFHHFTDPGDFRFALEQLFDIEQRSWKANADSLLPANERAFFLALQEHLGTELGYHVVLLELDGRPVAGLFSLIHAGVWYAFLTYYDQAHAQTSPGRSVIRLAIERAFADPTVRRFDFIANKPFVQAWHPQLTAHRHWRIKRKSGIGHLLSPFSPLRSSPQPHPETTHDLRSTR